MELNVVVIFYSRHGKTESLALSAGVGAIQARANIRLRRVSEIEDSLTIESEYIAPRETDLEWADLVVLAIPSDAPEKMNQYLASLKDLNGKVAAPFTSRSITRGENDPALLALYAAAARAGLIVVPAPAEAAADPVQATQTHVRRVVEIARALKAHRAASNNAAAP